MSAHADQQDLLNFIKLMRQWPREIRLVHGDDSARQALKASIETMAAKQHHSVVVDLLESITS